MQLSQPPIYTPIMNADGTMSTVWVQWFSLVQTIVNRNGTDITSAPASSSGASPTQHYGGGTTVLTDPTEWLSINNLKVPAY